MSGVNFKSQIKMPIPPTDDNHVVRRKDLNGFASAGILGDFMYEVEVGLDFLKGILTNLGGSVNVEEPFLFYDAKKTIQSIMTAKGFGNIQDALDWLNVQTDFSFVDSSGNGYDAIGQQGVFYWTADGMQINDPGNPLSDNRACVLLPTVKVNETFYSMNFTWMTVIRTDQPSLRNNFLSDYGGGGMNLSFEMHTGGRLRFYRAGSPDITMPLTTWAAREGAIAYIAMSHNENYDGEGTRLLKMFVNGKLMLTHMYKGGSALRANSASTFLWGSDYRYNHVATKGVLKVLKLFDRPLTNYEVLKQMEQDMAVYGL